MQRVGESGSSADRMSTDRKVEDSGYKLTASACTCEAVTFLKKFASASLKGKLGLRRI
jgi:hypothetical protein